ncbi:MAG: glycoside hydrolase family 9 protein, partial [Cytophagales bacterium]|nr:glycoside hydrolase family 9 protein [Cytophagales bacterium]
SNPQTGFNSANTFSAGSTYQVRRVSDNISVFSGTPVAWNGGATHIQSGDKAWWFDFSAVTATGSYYIYDVNNNVGSHPFDISDCVYNEALKHAMRSYFYQRAGYAKTAAYAGAGWADGASHVGPQQDTDCRLYNNFATTTTSKNLSGGWYDAGDYNKYVNFTWEALIDLLLAYEENPTVWADNYNIPESGNGNPDILDEIKYEMDWLLRMQQSNGSVLCIVGGGGASPPSADTQARRYGPATTSATYTFASVCALAAIQYKSIGMTAYANTLQTAAINAYAWALANPGITFSNQANNLAAGEQDQNAYWTLSRQVSAAVFLYALTGTASYRTFVESNYTQINMMQWSYVFPFQSAQQDMLLYFTKLTGVTTSVANAIRNTYTNSVQTNNADNLPNFINQTDAYRAYLSDGNYTWGSNSTKCKQGNILFAMNTFGLNAANATNYRNAASGYLHYMHGINPLGIVYLTNMSVAGAEYSVREIYHSWFRDGSALWDRVGTSTYGPPPGFVPGGPNPSYNWDGCCPSGCGSTANNSLCVNLAPPRNQPVQKSFLEFNSNWPLNSWSVTENGIYYNASYVRLLSKFAGPSCNNPLTFQESASSKKLEENVRT